MKYLLYAVGFFGPVFMIRYRQQIGDMMGEAEWMNKVGGVYNFVVIIAVLVFFWTIATMTGTTDVLFAPILWLFPSPEAA